MNKFINTYTLMVGFISVLCVSILFTYYLLKYERQDPVSIENERIQLMLNLKRNSLEYISEAFVSQMNAQIARFYSEMEDHKMFTTSVIKNIIKDIKSEKQLVEIVPNSLPINGYSYGDFTKYLIVSVKDGQSDINVVADNRLLGRKIYEVNVNDFVQHKIADMTRQSLDYLVTEYQNDNLVYQIAIQQIHQIDDKKYYLIYIYNLQDIMLSKLFESVQFYNDRVDRNGKFYVFLISTNNFNVYATPYEKRFVDENKYYSLKLFATNVINSYVTGKREARFVMPSVENNLLRHMWSYHMYDLNIGFDKYILLTGFDEDDLVKDLSNKEYELASGFIDNDLFNKLISKTKEESSRADVMLALVILLVLSIAYLTYYVLKRMYMSIDAQKPFDTILLRLPAIKNIGYRMQEVYGMIEYSNTNIEEIVIQRHVRLNLEIDDLRSQLGDSSKLLAGFPSLVVAVDMSSNHIVFANKNMTDRRGDYSNRTYEEYLPTFPYSAIGTHNGFWESFNIEFNDYYAYRSSVINISHGNQITVIVATSINEHKQLENDFHAKLNFYDSMFSILPYPMACFDVVTESFTYKNNKFDEVFAPLFDSNELLHHNVWDTLFNKPGISRDVVAWIKRRDSDTIAMPVRVPVGGKKGKSRAEELDGEEIVTDRRPDLYTTYYVTLAKQNTSASSLLNVFVFAENVFDDKADILYRDITDRLILGQENVGSFLIDASTNNVRFNKVFYKMFDLEEGTPFSTITRQIQGFAEIFDDVVASVQKLGSYMVNFHYDKENREIDRELFTYANIEKQHFIIAAIYRPYREGNRISVLVHDNKKPFIKLDSFFENSILEHIHYNVPLAFVSDGQYVYSTKEYNKIMWGVEKIEGMMKYVTMEKNDNMYVLQKFEQADFMRYLVKVVQRDGRTLMCDIYSSVNEAGSGYIGIFIIDTHYIKNIHYLFDRIYDYNEDIERANIEHVSYVEIMSKLFRYYPDKIFVFSDDASKITFMNDAVLECLVSPVTMKDVMYIESSDIFTQQYQHVLQKLISKLEGYPDEIGIIVPSEEEVFKGLYSDLNTCWDKSVKQIAVIAMQVMLGYQGVVFVIVRELHREDTNLRHVRDLIDTSSSENVLDLDDAR